MDEVGEGVEAFAAAVVDQVERGVPLVCRGCGSCGRILEAWTMAPVRPASRSSWRKAELRTTRAAGLRPKLDVGEADDGVAVGEVLGDAARAFDGFEGVAAVFLDAGGDGEDEGVEEDVLVVQAVFVDGEVADALWRWRACGRRCGPWR